MPKRGNIFKEQLISTPKRSWFDMSFDNTFTCNMGDCVPTICNELLPGDVIKQRSSAMMRFMPLVAPAMGKVNLFSYHFIVRNRDIWTEFDKFITNNDQKATWQQQQSFVPPEMPFIDLSEFFVNKNIPSSFFLSNDHTVSDSIKRFLGLTKNCYYLIQYELNNEYYSFISKKLPTSDKLHNDSLDDYFVYAFVPNREDIFPNDKTTKYYNPCGAGSLFEFLGCNIDGYFAHVAETLFGHSTSIDGDDSFRTWAYGMSLRTWTITPWSSIWGYSQGSGHQPVYPDPSIFGLTDDDILAFVPTEKWCKQHMWIGAYTQGASDAWRGSWYVDGYYAYEYVQGELPEGFEAGKAWYSPFNTQDDNPYGKPADFDYKVSALSLRAYRFIYDEYFRDQNYIEVNPNTDFSRSGNDLDWLNRTLDEIWEYITFERKAFEHDVYTTALPGPQKGDPVRYLADANLKVEVTGGYSSHDVHTLYVGKDSNLANGDTDLPFFGGTTKTSVNTNPVNLSVDLSAATIENFRWANAMQRYLERMARTGGRYYEWLLGIWNSDVADAKLNRPIYLGGDKTPIQISEVTQTSASDPQTGQPLGDLAGRGVAVGQDKRFSFSMPDYGFLFEFCVVVPRTCYGQGIKPMFKRFNYMDYPLPDFSQLGEQAVMRRELYATCKKSNDDQAFGYQSRYYDWKYNRDEIHSSMLTDMAHWNFARLFDDVPYAGQDFLEVKPSYRQFAVTDDNYDHCMVTMWHDIQINRALPEYGTPIL